MTLSTNVVNEALNCIGFDGSPVTGVSPNFDTSTAGQVAAKSYAPIVAAVARMLDWDFTRTTSVLSLSGNPAPAPWVGGFEYLYPANCAQLWQLLPSVTGPLFNPTPVTWSRGIATVSSVQASVIWTYLASAWATFDGNPLEQTWDSLFRQSVVNLLAVRFANAALGKPDMATFYTETFGPMLQLSRDRMDS